MAMVGCTGEWVSDGVAGTTGAVKRAGKDGCEYWRRVYEIDGRDS